MPRRSESGESKNAAEQLSPEAEQVRLQNAGHMRGLVESAHHLSTLRGQNTDATVIFANSTNFTAEIKESPKQSGMRLFRNVVNAMSYRLMEEPSPSIDEDPSIIQAVELRPPFDNDELTNTLIERTEAVLGSMLWEAVATPSGPEDAKRSVGSFPYEVGATLKLTLNDIDSGDLKMRDMDQAFFNNLAGLAEIGVMIAETDESEAQIFDWAVELENVLSPEVLR